MFRLRVLRHAYKNTLRSNNTKLPIARPISTRRFLSKRWTSKIHRNHRIFAQNVHRNQLRLFSPMGTIPVNPSNPAVHRVTPESDTVTSASSSDGEKNPHEFITNPTETSQSASVIFELIFNEITQKMGGDFNMVFPKDIMWLAGAPGSGKGEMTDWIQFQRGYHTNPIQISHILEGPEIEAIKREGKLVSDRIVLTILLERLLSPSYRTGVIVDGFPRTRLQAECIKLLFDKMLNLRRKYDGTDYFPKFRRPKFHITVLYVGQAISIERQLNRGKELLEHNKRVEATGVGNMLHIRETDRSFDKAKQRFEYFRDHIYASLQITKEKFPFHFISAEADKDTVKKRILMELEYQSDSELADETFDLVRRCSLASEIKLDARHKLVTRLDHYVRDHQDLFENIINIFKYEFEPYVRQQALTGHCIISSQNEIFVKSPNSLSMMLDLLAERGYRCVLDVIKSKEPVKVDLNTGNIHFATKKVFKFHINFPPPKMRHAMQSYETDVSLAQ